MANSSGGRTLSVGLVSLGCSKNLVDTQNMCGVLVRDGITLAPNPDEADVVLVNTCALNQYVSRTVPGNVQVRGEADEAAGVTVNGNPAWRNGEYFYGGDYADNTTLPVFREVAIEAVVPAATPDGWDEIDAVTSRLFVAAKNGP